MQASSALVCADSDGDGDRTRNDGDDNNDRDTDAAHEPSRLLLGPLGVNDGGGALLDIVSCTGNLRAEPSGEPGLRPGCGRFQGMAAMARTLVSVWLWPWDSQALAGGRYIQPTREPRRSTWVEIGASDASK